MKAISSIISAFAAIAVIAAAFTSCQRNDQALADRALELCKYIPDHCILDDAADYLTPEFYLALTEAWDAPDGAFPGEIGESEWLYYFVSGNGGAIPQFKVVSAHRRGRARASAKVLLSQVWEIGGESFEERICDLEMAFQDGEWLLDDFDGIKNACILYVQDLREKYRTGAFITQFESYLQENPDQRDVIDPDGTYASDLYAAIQRFYEVYGE